MKNLRDYLNLIEDISQDSEPAVGDIVHIEMGDTLLETHIVEVLDDGVVIETDATALRMMMEAREMIAESRTKDQMRRDAMRMTRSEFVERYPDGGEFWDTEHDVQKDDDKKLTESASDDLEFALKKAREITKQIKYDDTPMSIIVEIKTLAEEHGIDQSDLNSAIDEVLEAQRHLESSIYALDELFVDALRTARYRDEEELGETGAPAPHRLSPKPSYVTEEHEQHDAADAVASAITRRIMMRHTDMLSQYGVDAVIQAIDDVAENYRGRELDEIGSSDVSGWVSDIMRNLADSYGGKMDEAKYQGREVPLGKPMAGDVAKSKVYVRGPKGNVVKVNFGQKGVKIKKSNPGRRKNFRARHNCDNPGPRWKARYWSCRAW